MVPQMQNPACQLEFTFFKGDPAPTMTRKGENDAELCFACGDKLFSPDAEACSWKSRRVTWQILATEHKTHGILRAPDSSRRNGGGEHAHPW